MKIIFAGLKTTGKVDTVWAIVELRENMQRPPLWGQRNREPLVLLRTYDYMIVWGRRNGKMRNRIEYCLQRPDWNYMGNNFKNFGIIAQIGNDKIKQGYKPVFKYETNVVNYTAKLSDISPNFETELERLATWELLKV